MVLSLSLSIPVSGQDSQYSTGLVRWRAADDGFRNWTLDGARLAADGTLRLDRGTADRGSDPYPPAGYHDHDYYNGGTFRVGEALSPVTDTSFGFVEAGASWNAHTPPGTWIETFLRVRLGERWTSWYSLGIWASGTRTVARHSVDEQADADGYVDTDTLVVSHQAGPASAFQVRVHLFSADRVVLPRIRNMAVTFSTSPEQAGTPTPGDPSRWGRILPVPQCSQMVYPDGGEVWCSPTSTAMVLSYWQASERPCAPVVHAAVEGVYDWLYDGHGNWPFNTAYAATVKSSQSLAHKPGSVWALSRMRGASSPELEAYVARFDSLAQAEAWIAAGVPVIVSLAWGYQELTGAAFPASDGHLAVLVGFDSTGNPVVNDPGALTDTAVQRTYLRNEFESAWLRARGGTVYLVYPFGWPVPES